MKKILRFIAVWGLMALAAGCSMKRIAVNKLGNALASGGSTFEGDEDPDLVAALAATAAAQPAKPIANWANLNQLVTGAEIRVTLANGKTLRGFMQRVTPESLAINATTSQETLSRQDIRRVDLKRGTAVHRWRQRYAELLREQIAASVADPEEVDAGIRFLLAALERV